MPTPGYPDTFALRLAAGKIAAIQATKPQKQPVSDWLREAVDEKLERVAEELAARLSGNSGL